MFCLILKNNRLISYGEVSMVSHNSFKVGINHSNIIGGDPKLWSKPKKS